MGKNFNAFVNQIVADAMAKIEEDVVAVSRRVRQDFIDKAHEATLMYYSSYRPVLYDRTFNLMDNVVDEDFNGPTQYGGWVQFNSNNMGEYKHPWPLETVVSNFGAGIHGNPGVEITTPVSGYMDAFQAGYKKTLDGYFTSLGYTVYK